MLRREKNFELGHFAVAGSPDRPRGNAAAHDVCRKGKEDGLTVNR
jgi:hypothetical protein